MKFSGKMCLKIILKVTKNQGFSLFLEDTLFEKPQGGTKLTPPAVLGLRISCCRIYAILRSLINVLYLAGTTRLTSVFPRKWSIRYKSSISI